MRWGLILHRWQRKFCLAMGARDPAIPSLILAIVIVVGAVLLALWQAHDRRHRPAPQSDDDTHHYAHQDLRRLVGAVVMTLLAAGILIGSRINPRLSRPMRLWFAGLWLGVLVLIVILLVLAWRDWLATVRYARRQRRAIVEERRAILAAHRQRPSAASGESSANGQSNGMPH